MYIIERIIGIITYMGTLLVYTYLIYNTNSKRDLKRYLIFYWISLGIMAFFYIPDKSHDLYRLLEFLHKYSKMSFAELMDVFLETNTPSQSLYFWIIGKTKIDKLLPTITSMIFFGNVFTITYKCAEKYNIDNKNIAISLLFFMEFGKFLEVISGIRSLMAFSIIALCIYTEIIENKKIIKNIPLYIFAAFMHPAALVLTMIRIVFLLFQKENGIIKKILNIVLTIILGYISYKYANDSIVAATEKAESYMSHHVYSYIWEYILCWTYVLFSTYTLFKYKNFINTNVEIKNLRKIILFINFTIMIFNFEYSIFNRFSTFSGILYIPMFSVILQNIKDVSKEKRERFTYLFMVISSFIFILASTRGNLSGYKYLLFK